jgi:hypothetical protein
MPSLALGVSINSIPVMGRGETPDPNAPDIASLTLVGSGEVGDELSYSVSYTTPPYPSPTRVPQWLKDGVEIEGETAHTYTPTPNDEGSAISVRLFVQNSEGFDSAVSNSIPITWPAPILQDVAVSPSSGNTGDTFTGSFTLVGLGVTVEDRWLLNGVEIAGATGPTYQARPEDGTATLSYRVRATNSGGSVEVTASPAATLTYAEAPEISNAAIIPSSATVGQGLVADYDVTGVPTPTVTFQWEKDGTPVSGATSATFVPTLAGQYTCVITATNTEGADEVETAAITVSAITPGGPTISGIPDQSYDVDDGVQELDLATYADGDDLVFSEIQTDNLVAIAALVVQEGTGGTRDCSTAFPYAAPAVAFSYALTGPAATFVAGSDPRGGITDADLPSGVSINAATGLLTVTSGAADMTATNFTVWKFTGSVVASQTISVTITATPDDVWDITAGDETATVNSHPSVSTPTASAGVETVTRTA